MKTMKFKTNINCGGCVKAVTPFLDKESAISQWEVDTNNPDKILTITSDTLTEDAVIEVVKKAGYSAQQV